MHKLIKDQRFFTGERLFLICSIVTFLNCLRLFWNGTESILFGSFDTGWIIKVGGYILGHGIPRQDVLSWTCAGLPFVAYQWSFELAAAALFAIGGLWLVGLTSCVSSAILYLWILPQMWLKRGIPAAVPFFALSLVLTPHWFNIRPQLVSSFFLLAYVSVLQHFVRTRDIRILLVLPVLTVLWVNAHLFWSIGLMLICIYAVCDLWRYYFKPKKIGSVTPIAGSGIKVFGRSPWPLLFCLLVCAAAVFLNPYHKSLVSYLISFLNGHQYMGMYEVMPSAILREAVFVLLYLTLVWRILWIKRQHVPLEAWLITGIATVAAVFVRRYESVAVLLTWPYLGDVLRQLEWPSFWQLQSKFALSMQRQIFVLPLFAILIAVAAWCVRYPTGVSANAAYTEGAYPLLRFIAGYLKNSDRTFNDPTTGDWMIFTSTAPVFIDTRYDMYPRLFCHDVFACMAGAPGALDYIKSYRCSHIIVRDDFAPICKVLENSRDWQLTCDDGTISFWSNLQQDTAERLRLHHIADADLSKRTSALPSGTSQITLNSRYRNYLTLARRTGSGDPGAALSYYERALGLKQTPDVEHEAEVLRSRPD
jgi:hypothetical protein